MLVESSTKPLINLTCIIGFDFTWVKVWPFKFIWNNISGSHKQSTSQLVLWKCSQTRNHDVNWPLPSKTPCFIMKGNSLQPRWSISQTTPGVWCLNILRHSITSSSFHVLLHHHNYIASTWVAYTKTLCLFHLHFCYVWHWGCLILGTTVGTCGGICN